MAEKIIGVEVKSLVYDIEDSKTRSIAEDALSNANSAVVKADETASALAPVAQSVAEIEANIGSNDISEIASNASAALEATEEIPPLQEKIGDVDISAAGDSVTDAISKMNEILGNVSGAVYSTEEKLVGKWIDGRDLYQKTFTATLTSQPNVYTRIPLNIPNVKNIFLDQGASFWTNGLGFWPLAPYGVQFDSVGPSVFCFVSASHFEYRVFSSAVSQQIVFTVKYTKNS